MVPSEANVDNDLEIWVLEALWHQSEFVPFEPCGHGSVFLTEEEANDTLEAWFRKALVEAEELVARRSDVFEKVILHGDLGRVSNHRAIWARRHQPEGFDPAFTVPADDVRLWQGDYACHRLNADGVRRHLPKGGN